jgi:hypothetical protein
MAAVMFFAGAWGYLRLLRLSAPPGQAAALPAGGGSLLGHTSMLLGLAALVATAVLAGVLVIARRTSPLAAGLPGLLFLAWTALYLVNVHGAVEFIPLRSHAFGAGTEALLFNGVLAAVGAVMVLPMFVPSRWREPQAVADASARQADAQLLAVWPDSAPRQRDRREPDSRPRETRPREEEPALTGTVLSYPADSAVRPVDTTRVTGASRALRATGSFSTVPGSVPRNTGSFRAAADTGLLGRPYYQSPDHQ